MYLHEYKVSQLPYLFHVHVIVPSECSESQITFCCYRIVVLQLEKQPERAGEPYQVPGWRRLYAHSQNTHRQKDREELYARQKSGNGILKQSGTISFLKTACAVVVSRN